MFPIFEELRFRDYKSFKDCSAISTLKNINIFIGRNNCGKSSCIDVIQSLVEDKAKPVTSQIEVFYKITMNDYKLMISNSSYWNYRSKPNSSQIINQVIKLELNSMDIGGRNLFSYNGNKQLFTDYYVNINDVIDGFNRKINEIKFYRLNAERDILPEGENNSISLSENGNGAVNLIHHVLHYEKYKERYVREDLLKALNEIMNPDSNYEDITVQKINNEKWEVFLYEGGNRFRLSQMGSGLKTIILVLLYLLVIPRITSNGTDDRETIEYENIVYAFEELENNLHPALQRRLFDYIYKFSKQHETTIFLTSHSHVAINLFADTDEAQLYHVYKEKGKSSIHKVEDYITKCEILNDLDVKASDLLQSNGIIWVEGPSDKVYIKRWLELWGNHNLIEGEDYQFLYYGGKILSHFTADPEAKDKNLINILSTNRNSAIVIDSDVCGVKNDINNTKKRIKKEFEDANMFCWITDGKEIENYIPFQAINNAFHTNLNMQCRKNELFPKYIKKVIGDAKFDKVSFSHKIIECINDDNSSDILDLKEKIVELSNTIMRWNSK